MAKLEKEIEKEGEKEMTYLERIDSRNRNLSNQRDYGDSKLNSLTFFNYYGVIA